MNNSMISVPGGRVSMKEETPKELGTEERRLRTPHRVAMPSDLHPVGLRRSRHLPLQSINV